MQVVERTKSWGSPAYCVSGSLSYKGDAWWHRSVFVLWPKHMRNIAFYFTFNSRNFNNQFQKTSFKHEQEMDFSFGKNCKSVDRVISGFWHEADESCICLGYYAASSCKSLAKFRCNPSSKILTPLKMRPIPCPETSVRNYKYSLRDNPEENGSQVSWLSTAMEKMASYIRN
jgi:hypothetical protein